MSLRPNYGERGGSRSKLLVAIAFFAALIFCGVKIIPIFVNNYDLQDSMQQEARFVFNPNTGHPKTEDEIRTDIVKRAMELGLPVTDKNLEVIDQGGHVRISADYTISVDLVIYQLPLHFHPQADNTSI
ncbi:MAG TPA: hypothetical protein VGT03_13675 [Candidatus Acidoferrales bacterium]|nr:hypothetical protein [Candidatus Acidoferrales bacterium]